MKNKPLHIAVGITASAAFLFGTVVAGATVRTDKAKHFSNEAAAAVNKAAAPATTTTTRPPREADPPNAALPTLPGGALSRGSSGPEVQAYEQRLADLKFDPGPVDGKYDASTVYAVQGYQKLEGLPVTGVIRAADQISMSFFKWPDPLIPNGEPNRTEVDVAKQVLVKYENYNVRLITTVSTGAGEYYCYIPTKGGVSANQRVCTYADTPSGRYEFGRRYNGWEETDLGGHMFNPVYFNGGIAVHGYPEVPVKAASHGCVRIPIYVAAYFPTLVEKGDPIYIVGGANGARPTTRTDLPSTTVAPDTSSTPDSTAVTTTVPTSSTTPTTVSGPPST